MAGGGWELRVERLGMHQRGVEARTYGRYRVSIDGQSADGLDGFMVEAIGPGDNAVNGNGRRIAAGRYPLTTHFRSFVTTGYSASAVAGDAPMPALRLLSTHNRTGILIHPAHPPAPKLYVASVGCLNPTAGLDESEDVDFRDSRARVIALIDSLRGFAPEAFADAVPMPIAGAVVIIAGEPLHRLSA